VQVMGVTPNSPAHDADLKEGDIIISLDNKPTKGVNDIHRMLGKKAVGVKLDIVILRNWTTRLQKYVVPTESPN